MGGKRIIIISRRSLDMWLDENKSQKEGSRISPLSKYHLDCRQQVYSTTAHQIRDLAEATHGACG